MSHKSKTPDLFEAGTAEAAPPLRSPLATEELSGRRRVLLPADLAGILKHLDENQFDELLRAVTAEARSRGRAPPEQRSVTDAEVKEVPRAAPRRAKPTLDESPAVPHGKANMIRAAFKAGMKPSAISREFRISLSVVRHVLAS